MRTVLNNWLDNQNYVLKIKEIVLKIYTIYKCHKVTNPLNKKHWIVSDFKIFNLQIKIVFLTKEIINQLNVMFIKIINQILKKM